MGSNGDWGLGTGDWGLGNQFYFSQSPITNHQSLNFVLFGNVVKQAVVIFKLFTTRLSLPVIVDLFLIDS
jgi:hypothetical protein